jgi:Tfp pilus assembly protein PilN
MSTSERAESTLYALPDELTEHNRLIAEAKALDRQREALTARLNVLRQRFAQRRLAAERGRPNHKLTHLEASR